MHQTADREAHEIEIAVSFEQFEAWLKSLNPLEQIGIAGGITFHPVPKFLSRADNTHCYWCLQSGGQILVWKRDRAGKTTAGCVSPWDVLTWIGAFYRELRRGDSYRTVTVAECLEVLERIKERPA